MTVAERLTQRGAAVSASKHDSIKQGETKMVRPEQKSEVILQAQQRLTGMKSIHAKLDLGNGCSVISVEAKLKETREKKEATTSY